MKINRRDFLKNLGMTYLFGLLGSLPFFRRVANASSQGIAKLTRFRTRIGQNIFMAFNNIKNPEDGESDEFTTIRSVQEVLKRMEVPTGTSVIGIGARTGGPNAPYASPGEMGYLWKVGDEWNAKVTHHVDASPVPLHLDDPIIVSQVGVLYESTAHHFEINDPSLEGSVLWTLYNDDTGSKTLDVGMHNLFSDVDGGLLEQIYKSSQKATEKPEGWASSRDRSQLQKFMPRLSNDRVWNNFSATLGKTFVHTRWREYVREQRWPGAAVVLKGSMQNVTQFHLREWVRKSPQEPEFEIGKGTHTFLKIKAGREARPFITKEEGAWTMVGFIWDLDSQRSNPAMNVYRDFSDIFGQDFHIHGFKNDGSVGGHTLCALLGSGKLSVSLYPLSFDKNESAFLFNNDLKWVPDSVVQSSAGLSAIVHNDGENWVRNVSLQLSRKNGLGSYVDTEKQVLSLLKPGERRRVQFKGKAATIANAKRRLWVDREGHFLEGGSGAQNNRLEF
jgi:hypothetical protein